MLQVQTGTRRTPELFCDKNEAWKSMCSSRMTAVQTKLAGRALELPDLPEDKPCYLLDSGCSTGRRR